MMDNRGVSSTLNYVLGLGVATVLVMGLLIAGGNLIEDQREQVVRNEMAVLGQQVASDLASADRFTQEGGAVTLERDLPKSVAGETYRITVSPGVGAEEYYLTLTSARTDVSVRIGFTSETTVTPSSVDGGPIQIVGDGSTVVIHNG